MSKVWSALTVAVLALGCGGEEDSQGEPIAQEVGDSCLLRPGDYVFSYSVLDTTASCEGFEPLPDEFVSVSSPTQVVLPASAPPMGCVDTVVDSRGCFAVISRECTTQTVDGLAQVRVLFQFWLDEGEGIVTFSGSLYSGAVLLDSCTVNLEATIRRRG